MSGGGIALKLIEFPNAATKRIMWTVHEKVSYGGRQVAGFGLGDVEAPILAAAATHPILLAMAGGMAAATTGWVLEAMRRRRSER